MSTVSDVISGMIHEEFLSSNARPLSVSRYFCLLLRGLSGIVISIRPASKAGRKISVRKYLRSAIPIRSCSSSLSISPVQIRRSRSTWGVLGGCLPRPRHLIHAVHSAVARNPAFLSPSGKHHLQSIQDQHRRRCCPR